MTNTGARDEVSLDTWMALLAGSAPWWTTEEHERAWDRLLGFAQLGSAALGVAVLVAATEVGQRGPSASLGVIIAVTSLLLLAGQPLVNTLRPQPVLRSLWPNLMVRMVLLLASWLAIRIALPGWSALWSTPAATALGIDIVNTCRQLGWQTRSALWYRRFVTSSFHLGIVGALIAMFVAASDDSAWIAVQNFVSLHAWVAVATFTVWLVSTLQRTVVGEHANLTELALADEHRARAHWLHDDVCAQLQLLSMRVTTEDMSKEDLLVSLDDLDHHLRLRQLEELFGTGAVRVAEVLQPFIRHAQARGVTIAGVPAFERAATMLPERAARLAARAAGVLTANALNAGATTISFQAESLGEMLAVTIDDNGPGFRLEEVPDGRGLSTLMADLRPGEIRVTARPTGGVSVTATIPVNERSGSGFHPAR